MQDLFLLETNQAEEDGLELADTNIRIQKLERQVDSFEQQLKEKVSGENFQDLRERVATVEGQLKSTQKSPNIILITLLTILGTGVVVYFSWLGWNVHDLGTRMAVIERTLIPNRLAQVAAHPQDTDNIKKAIKELDTAKKGHIRIDPNVIKDTGDQFIEATEKQPLAWQAVQQYLEYRSFLNTSLAPLPGPLDPFEVDVLFRGKLVSPKGKIGVFVARGHNVSPENSARLEKIGESNPSIGVDRIVIEGKEAAILLDDLHMKNVIIRNLQVEYKGGPVFLENVIFINCIFKFEPSPKSRELGKAILASTGTVFNSAKS